MKRVAIIGSPGTGKSTFANQLGELTKLPLIHLDYYYHDKQRNYYTNKEAWRAQANAFTNDDTWIIDGNFAATMARRLERADTIFYFDMPTRTALRGVVKRWLTPKQRQPGMPKDWQEKPSWSFFWKVLRFRRRYTRDTQALLRRNADKEIVVFKNHRQADDYLA